MIIGLMGQKLSGKDTVAAYLIKKHGFERRASADALKQFIGAVFDLPASEIERHKSDPNVYVAIGYKTGIPIKDAAGPDHMWSPIVELTMREFQQRVGTDGGRDVLGEDLWIDISLPLNGYYAARNIVISDVRFPNEALRVRDLGGYIVRIDRPGLDNKDHHRNEHMQAEIAAHYTILNDDTLETLYERTELMLDDLTSRV